MRISSGTEFVATLDRLEYSTDKQIRCNLRVFPVWYESEAPIGRSLEYSYDDPMFEAELRCTGVVRASVERYDDTLDWSFKSDDPILDTYRAIERITCCTANLRLHARELEHQINVLRGPWLPTMLLHDCDDGTLSMEVPASIAEHVCAYFGEHGISYYRQTTFKGHDPVPSLADFGAGYIVAVSFDLDVPPEWRDRFAQNHGRTEP